MKQLSKAPFSKEYQSLILLRGDRSSVKVLMRAFITFSEASGLAMNQEKSEIYMNGVPPLEAEAILQLSGFQVGHFPFKYLGFPISFKKLSNAECNILVDRTVARIRSWGAKKLSYAGRLVLVRSVLSQLRKDFSVVQELLLWYGTDDYHKIPALAWDTCCLPKDREGLGILHCQLWNLVVIGKFSWWIAQKWVHHIYMKQGDWWSYHPSVNSSAPDLQSKRCSVLWFQSQWLVEC
ncbi:uncharacterized protein LOC141623679 isoform X1 [Silene latifolia]|uniref:uncharacterized protein LOC141623679 isoform X1 n=1 Tax=Silene latifolia TaxID=37657 RepID=UPI003D7709B0